MFRPLSDNIVTLRVDPESETRGGIIIPDIVQGKESICTVMAVGPDVCEEIQVGDKILVGKYLGTEIIVDHEELLIVSDADVLAHVEGD